MLSLRYEVLGDSIMIYLDEDCVNFQIENCQQIEDTVGKKCVRCGKVKKFKNLCPLGIEWAKDNELLTKVCTK
jgi:hypothetical protein